MEPQMVPSKWPDVARSVGASVVRLNLRETFGAVARRPRRLAVLFCIAGALIVAPVALGWYQYYVWNGYFNPGGIAQSSSNSNLNYQEMKWDSHSGTQFGAVTYCNGSCNPYTYGNTGLLQDRASSISYGNGKCYSPTSNTLGYTVNWCYVSN